MQHADNYNISSILFLYMLHCELVTLPLLSTLYSLLSTLYSLLSTLYSLLSTLYSLLSTLYSTTTLLSTLYSLLSTIYSLLSTLYSHHSTKEGRLRVLLQSVIFQQLAEAPCAVRVVPESPVHVHVQQALEARMT